MSTKKGQPGYIDFTTLTPKKYKKKLTPPLEPDEFAERLNLYFDTHNKVNFYSLSLFFGMSDLRFTNNYLKSDDKELQHLAKMAINMISSIALDNADEYSKSLRYIMARQNTEKDFIELSDEVIDSNTSKIVILPAKGK